MKFLITVCVLALAALVAECKECEEGKHLYETNCGPLTPEATCDRPYPEAREGNVCDYSACYCDPPTVKDTDTGKCIPFEDCGPNIKKE